MKPSRRRGRLPARPMIEQIVNPFTLRNESRISFKSSGTDDGIVGKREATIEDVKAAFEAAAPSTFEDAVLPLREWIAEKLKGRSGSAAVGSPPWYAERLQRRLECLTGARKHGDLDAAVRDAYALGCLVAEGNLEFLRKEMWGRGKARTEQSRDALREAGAGRWKRERNEADAAVRLANQLSTSDPEEFGSRCRKRRAEAVSERLGITYGRAFRILRNRRA